MCEKYYTETLRNRCQLVEKVQKSFWLIFDEILARNRIVELSVLPRPGELESEISHMG